MIPIDFEKHPLAGQSGRVLADPQLIDRNFQRLQQSEPYIRQQLRYYLDVTAVGVNRFLPDGRNVVDKDFLYVKTDASTNTIVIFPFAGQTINGAASYTLTKRYSYVLLIFDYTTAEWKIIASSNVLSSGGIVGTTTNDNAPAGFVGEWLFAQLIRASSAALTSGVNLDLASFAITAGDWMIGGQAGFTPANTTTVTSFIGWFNTASLTLPSFDTGQRAQWGAPYTSTGAAHVLQLPSFRLSLSAPATVYLSVQSTFGVSTNVAFGNIWARRVR